MNAQCLQVDRVFEGAGEDRQPAKSIRSLQEFGAYRAGFARRRLPIQRRRSVSLDRGT